MTGKCVRCKNYYDDDFDHSDCGTIIDGEEIDLYIPRTNADKIRAMTDEELAEFLADSSNLLDKASNLLCRNHCPKRNGLATDEDCDYAKHGFEDENECEYPKDKDVLKAWLGLDWGNEDAE